MHSPVLQARCPQLLSALQRQAISTTASVFSIFLHFIYCGVVETTQLSNKSDEDILDLLELAHKYYQNSLIMECQRVLLAKENWEVILKKANDRELVVEVDGILQHVVRCKELEEWRGKIKQLPAEIQLKFDTIAKQTDRATITFPQQLIPSSSIISDLNQLRYSVANETTDHFTIIAEQQPIHVHKCILGIRSAFYAGLLRNQTMSNTSTHTTELPYDLCNKIVSFLYTARDIEFTAVDCVWMLSDAVQFYLIEYGDSDIWLRLAKERTNVKNCLQVYETYIKLQVENAELLLYVHRLIAKHFEELESEIEEMECIETKITLLTEIAPYLT